MPDVYLWHASGTTTTPPTPPPVPNAYRYPFQMNWTGWDGSTWDLTTGAQALFLTHGIRGLAMPPVEHYTQESPALPGARWRGARVQQREVFWPLYLYSDGTSADWVAWDRQFWKTMQPDKPGTWSVTAPGTNSTRYLQCRFMDDDDHSFDQDPAHAGWELYGIRMFAEQPYWQGDLISRTWVAPGASTSFFGTGGPPFTIGVGSTTATATMDNPGDVNAYPVYRISGPASTATVGVQGRTIVVPFALTAGQVLTIDTAPDKQTAVDLTGADRTSELGAVDFAPIPPGTSVTMSLTMTGTGAASQVNATIRPSYYRAW